MNLITFLSDFGTKSGYVAQMKGVATAIAPQVKCIDISHGIPPQDIQAGALVLQNSVSYFPKGTIHVAVVDPGVGTKRRGIVVLTRTQILVGPDNGLLIPAARSLGTFRVYEITNPLLQREKVSKTFHGRDIFAPIAAHILNGVSFDKIGPEIYDYVDLRFPLAVRKDDVIDANVLLIDDFGNVITNVEYKQIETMAKPGDEIVLSVGKKKHKLKFVESYGFVKKGDLLATVGSSGLLEISINQGNASEFLTVHREDAISFDFSEISKDNAIGG